MSHKLLYIDLFCGAGGTSTGVERARLNGKKCAKVIACVNHDPNAIKSHAANHPRTKHFTEDIRTLDMQPLQNIVDKERAKDPDAIIVLWASLECTNFSRAKGGQPRDADSRTLAEHLFRYIEALRPHYIYIENVEEFMSWGDVDEHGKPVSMDKGIKYLKWVRNVESYGYRFDYRILNAADYGARTRRTRFFGIFAAQCYGIAWPEPTHCKDGRPGDMFSPPMPKWKPVRPVLNLSEHGQSIFNRKKPLSERTLERIYKGLIKFVAGGKEAFLSKQFSGDPSGKNIGIDEPSGAITCKDHHALVQAQFIDAQYGNGFSSSIDDPLPTATPKDKFSIVSSQFLANEYSGGGQLASIDSAAPAILTTPKQKLVTVNQFIVNTSYKSKGCSIDEPVCTVIARMDKSPLYLATVEEGNQSHQPEGDSEYMRLIKEFMRRYGIVDIYMRMLSVKELKMAQGFPEDYILCGTQTEQKKYIGNAVEVNMSRALCEALARETDGYITAATADRLLKAQAGFLKEAQEILGDYVK